MEPVSHRPVLSVYVQLVGPAVVQFYDFLPNIFGHRRDVFCRLQKLLEILQPAGRSYGRADRGEAVCKPDAELGPA